MSLHRAIAAAVTPLRDNGHALDGDGFGPLVRFLSEGGMDGLLAMGTTGEGVLLSLAERRWAAERFVEARPEGSGSPSTAARRAPTRRPRSPRTPRRSAPMPWPWSRRRTTRSTRRSCSGICAAPPAPAAPLPFYVYEFEARSGYPIPILRDRTPAQRRGEPAWPEGERPALAGGGPSTCSRASTCSSAPSRSCSRASRPARPAPSSGLGKAFPETVAKLVHDRDPAAHRRWRLARGPRRHPVPRGHEVRARLTRRARARGRPCPATRPHRRGARNGVVPPLIAARRSRPVGTASP